MRILRGKSSSEVSSQGFALFVVGIIISTFLGGAVRTFLNSNAIQVRLMAEAQKRWPDVSIEIGNMQGLLSRGIWPGFVLKFENVHLVRRSCQGPSLQIDLENMSAPIRLLSLWRGKARLGKVEANGVKARLFNQPCAKEEPTDVATAASSKAKGTAETSLSEPRKLNLDWSPLAKAADGVVVHDLEFFSESEPGLKTVVHRLNVDIGTNLDISGEIELQKSLPFGPSSHVMNLTVHGGNGSAQILVAGKFREGQIEWKGQLDLQKQSYHQQLAVHQVPIKDVLIELYKFGVLQNEMPIKSLWLSCELAQDGILSDWRAQDVTARNCKVDGGQGKIEITEAQVPIRGGSFIGKPIQLTATNFQLAPLLEAFRRDTLPKVFSKLGTWSGEAVVESEEKWHVDGQLKGVEVIFSSQSVRGKQIVNSLRTEFSKGAEGVTGRLSEIDLNDGKSEGEASFRLDSMLKSGTIELKFKNILLNPSIQKILIGGSMKNLKLMGEGRLALGNLESWVGEARSEAIDGPGWIIENAVGKSVFKNGIFRIEAMAASFTAQDSWPQFANVVSIYRRDGVTKMIWKDLSGLIEVNNKGGEILRFTSVESTAKMHLSAKGKWERDHDLIGTLNVSSDQGRKAYTVFGRQNQISIHSD
jgi:hypothetical protein